MLQLRKQTTRTVILLSWCRPAPRGSARRWKVRHTLEVYVRLTLEVYVRHTLEGYVRHTLEVYVRYTLEVYLRHALEVYVRHTMEVYVRCTLGVYVRHTTLEVYIRHAGGVCQIHAGGVCQPHAGGVCQPHAGGVYQTHAEGVYQTHTGGVCQTHTHWRCTWPQGLRYSVTIISHQHHTLHAVLFAKSSFTSDRITWICHHFHRRGKSVSNIAFIQDLLIIHSRLLTSNVMLIWSFSVHFSSLYHFLLSLKKMYYQDILVFSVHPGLCSDISYFASFTAQMSFKYQGLLMHHE